PTTSYHIYTLTSPISTCNHSTHNTLIILTIIYQNIATNNIDPPSLHDALPISLNNNKINGLAVDGGNIGTGGANLHGLDFWGNPDIVYVVTTNVNVNQGASLTICEGQVVKFNQNQGLFVFEGGTLDAFSGPLSL